MKKLTLIALLTVVGCWDFEGLSNGQILNDAGMPIDLTMCPKTPNSLQEDCLNPDADVNNNCLPGCLDPTCSTHSNCLVSKASYRGTGTARTAMMGCSGETPVYQNLATQNCTAACGVSNCNSGTCSGSINLFDQAACAGTAVKVNFPPAQMCSAVTVAASATPSVKLDKLTAGGCTPKMTTVNIPPMWSGTNYLCENKNQNGLFADLVKSNDCLVFDGDAVCPSTTFVNKQTFYTSASGMVACTCACGVAAGSCAIAGMQVRVSDSNTCATGGSNKNMSVTMDTNCLPIQDDVSKMAFTPKAVNFSATATCTASGTVASTPNPAGQVTLCCK